jgi:pyridoxal/pyridoxine/pyridoxamine kinase
MMVDSDKKIRSPMGTSVCLQGEPCCSDRRHSYVGNDMATTVLQALGCEVAAINTVNFSKSGPCRQAWYRPSCVERVMTPCLQSAAAMP